MTDEANRPLPDEPLSDELAPVWRVEAGGVRKLAKLIAHLDAQEYVTIENRGQGYLHFEFPDGAGGEATSAAMPADDA